jgi:hypothetical protein
LSEWCTEHGWKAVFFDGPSGAPRTGIVDAVIVRVRPGDADSIEVRLVQLKAGVGGLTGAEITRLKSALTKLSADWLLAAFDGEVLHLVPDIPARGKPPNIALQPTAVPLGSRTVREILLMTIAVAGRRRRSLSLGR